MRFEIGEVLFQIRTAGTGGTHTVGGLASQQIVISIRELFARFLTLSKHVAIRYSLSLFVSFYFCCIFLSFITA